MAIYNSNANYLRIKLPSGTILPFYVGIATGDLPTGNFSLNNLGQYWFTQYLARNSAINYIFNGAAYMLETGEISLYNLLTGGKNTVYSNSYTNNTPYGLGEYSQMFSNIGINSDSVFMAKVYNELDMENASPNTYYTLNCEILDDDGNKIDDLYIRMRWDSLSGRYDCRTYSQIHNTPFNTNDVTWYSTMYSLYTEMRIGSSGSWFTSGFICYNPDRTKLYFITLSKRESSSIDSISYPTTIEGYIRIVGSIANDTDYYAHWDSISISEYGISSYQEWLGNNIISAIRGSTPFSANGEDDFTATSGDYDGSTDSIDVEALPSSDILTSGMLKAYVVSGADVANLHNYMFSSSYTQALENIFNAPVDAVVKIHQIPVTPTSYADNITLGNADTGISSMRTSTKFIEVNLGNININAYYGLFSDYESTIELYLPFIGMVKLNIDDCINGVINVIYRFDIMTGDFVALVFSTNVNAKGYSYRSLIYLSGGNVSGSVPLTSGGYDIGNLTGSLANIIGASASGNILGATTTAVNGARNVLVPSYSYSGGLGGWSSFLGKRTPYIRLTIPNYKLPADFNSLHGFRSGYTGLVGDFNGYLSVNDCKVDISDYNTNERIKTLLKNGVFVENNGYTPVTTSNSISLLTNNSDDKVIDKDITLVSTVTGSFKSSVPLDSISIQIETDNNTFNSCNYIYIADINRFYFVRQKSAINNSIFMFNLECDYLQSFKDDIKAINVIANRSSDKYNALLPDGDIPRQLNNIVRYLEFSSGLTSDSTILICV